MVERYTYDAFGRTRIFDATGGELTQSAFGNPYMFTARNYDDETGLYYYRARMYAPDLGRFLQPDPIGYADSMNLYQYCLNNPINWVDPWGLKTILGIHSPANHSWITVNVDGEITTYGLWHKSKKKTNRVVPGGDLYRNQENKYPKTGRYYVLDAAQENRLEAWLKRKYKYRMFLGMPTNNCASWASATVYYVIGEDLNADDPDNGWWIVRGFETPAELGASIAEMEKADPTSVHAPQGPPPEDKKGSSSGGNSSSW